MKRQIGNHAGVERPQTNPTTATRIFSQWATLSLPLSRSHFDFQKSRFFKSGFTNRRQEIPYTETFFTTLISTNYRSSSIEVSSD